MPKNIFWPLLMYNSVITKTIWLHWGYFYILLFLHDSEPGRKWGHGEAVSADYKRPSPANQAPTRSKNKHRSTKEADKSKVVCMFFVFYLVYLYVKWR